MLHNGSMSARYGKYGDLEYVLNKWEILLMMSAVLAFCIGLLLGSVISISMPTSSNTYHQTCEQPAIQTDIAKTKRQDSSYPQ